MVGLKFEELGAKSGILPGLVGLPDCVAEINLSGILTENDIIVKCGEEPLFTRWPPLHRAAFVHIFYGFVHILYSFVHILCRDRICAVLYDLWHWGTVGNVTT